MKRKRLIAVGLIAFVMTTGTGIAFASIIEAAEPHKTTQVKKEVIISGPVKIETDPITAVLKSQAPEVGSIDWLAQQKAEKDKLRLDAQQKEAELQAEVDRLKAELEAEINRQAKIKQDTENLNNTIELVKAQIGITPWVFQGSSRRSWDCSGLVRWTYAQIGVDLYHSATVQRNAGTIVTEPKLGDLVSFNYRGNRGAFHIGIYLGPDQMIHSGGKPGDRTEIVSIAEWAKDNNRSQVVYTRIVETNN